MALPEAIVTVELTQIEVIPPGFVAPARNRVYAMTSIGGRELGRTPLVPTGAVTFALGRRLELPVAPGQILKVTVAIWEDRADTAPNQLWTFTHDIASPWTSGPFTFGGGPRVTGQVTTVTVLPSGAPVVAPRVGRGAPVVAAVVRPRRSFTVEFTEIQGLYEPAFTPGGPLGRPVRLAEYHVGYTSADHRGRIYLNRNLTGDWAKDVQAIQITTRVHVSRGSLPAGSRIRWTIADPDDPFDDDPHVHRQWAPYLDSNDYPAGTPSGAHDSDNEGAPDHIPRWELVAGFPLTVTSATEALTNIVGNESKVKIHCPNTAGDNLIVRAELRPVPAAASGRAFPAETGIMTMWNRIDVEYIKMNGALALPVADVPPLLEPACIQLDFQPVRNVADKLNMGVDAADSQTQSVAYVAANFVNKGTGGWFCLIAAMMPNPVSIVPDLFAGNVTLGSSGAGPTYEEFAIIPGDFPDAAVIEFMLAGKAVTFDVNRKSVIPGSGVLGFFGLGKVTKCFLEPHDFQHVFTAGDGSTDHAYASRLFFLPKAKTDGVTVTPGGYSMPSPVFATVKSNAGLYTAGRSPPTVVGGLEFFAGRTIIFTHHHRAYRDRITGAPLPVFHDNAVGTIAHEFTHAFGMPHKCGFFDLRTPRGKTCTMNYRVHWMIDEASNTLIAGTSENTGLNLCGRHIKELRRTHIEDNVGLGW